MPRRAPELLARIARRGAAGMPHVGGGAGSPFCRPSSKARSAGNKRHPGGVFFGYFLLAKHKFAWNEFEQPAGWPEGRKPRMVFVTKVSRLSGQDPTSKHSSRQRHMIPTARIHAVWIPAIHAGMTHFQDLSAVMSPIRHNQTIFHIQHMIHPPGQFRIMRHHQKTHL
jgi:hypothetical protein